MGEDGRGQKPRSSECVELHACGIEVETVCWGTRATEEGTGWAGRQRVVMQMKDGLLSLNASTNRRRLEGGDAQRRDH